MSVPRLASLVLVALGVLGTSEGRAQCARGAQWADVWSALAPVAELERGRIAERCDDGVLDAPPRTGLFWSAGNPAGLAFDAGPRFGRLDLRMSALEGDYRRPLDPPAVQAREGRAVGIQPLGQTGGLAGGVEYGELTYDPGMRAVTLLPYSSVPFVVTDTSAARNRAVHARIDGAGGWQAGRFGVGVAVGYQSLQGHSQQARIPRRQSLAHPAAVVGLAWRSATGRTSVGAQVRAFQKVEIGQIANAGRAVPFITRLNGFAQPTVVAVHSGSYYQRRNAEGGAAGLSASTKLGAWRVVAHGAAGKVHEGHFSQRVAEPPTDEWNASSLAAGMAAQRGLKGATVTAELRGASLRGDARLSGSDSTIYRGSERAIQLLLDGRRAPDDRQPWGYRLSVRLDYDNHDRGDTVQHAVRARVESLALLVQGGIARRITPALTLAAEGGHSRHSPRGTVPPAGQYPPDIRELADAELAHAGTPSTSWLGALAAEYAVGEAGQVRVDARYHSATPTPTDVRLAAAPAGSRSGWEIRLGVVLRE